MKSLSMARVMVGAALAGAIPAAAFAQPAWTPASEIVGQPVQVTTAGVTDTVTLSPGGQVTIASPGGHVVNGTWTAANGQLCLVTGPQECVPYTAPFQAGTPMTLTSSCGASETWLASATNSPPPPPPPPPGPSARGERGR